MAGVPLAAVLARCGHEVDELLDGGDERLLEVLPAAGRREHAPPHRARVVDAQPRGRRPPSTAFPARPMAMPRYRRWRAELLPRRRHRAYRSRGRGDVAPTRRAAPPCCPPRDGRAARRAGDPGLVGARPRPRRADRRRRGARRRCPRRAGRRPTPARRARRRGRPRPGSDSPARPELARRPRRGFPTRCVRWPRRARRVRSSARRRPRACRAARPGAPRNRRRRSPRGRCATASRDRCARARRRGRHRGTRSFRRNRSLGGGHAVLGKRGRRGTARPGAPARRPVRRGSRLGAGLPVCRGRPSRRATVSPGRASGRDPGDVCMFHAWTPG